MKLITVIIVAAIFIPTISTACQFTTDCNPGGMDIKSDYEMYGVCTDGISPGNMVC